ncbi:MAG: inositol monophosphatase family protein [Pseudomonadota bacterium]
MTLNPETALAVATEAALAAGKIVADGFSRPKEVAFKGEIDIVTQYDLASEKQIMAMISRAFPEHDILTEESGGKNTGAPFKWYVDPLDGTVNFAHGFPVFCISIACAAQTEHGPELLVGVVYDPMGKELFQAIKGRGAQVNGQALRIGDRADLNQALVATGFPYDLHQQPEPVLSRFRRMIMAVQGVRRPGSAALDLAWTAAGRFDGFWEERLHPWDVAAGVLLVREAGGRCTDFKGNDFVLDAKEILATNRLLHYNMLRILKENTLDMDKSRAALPREGA